MFCVFSCAFVLRGISGHSKATKLFDLHSKIQEISLQTITVRLEISTIILSVPALLQLLLNKTRGRKTKKAVGTPCQRMYGEVNRWSRTK